MIVKLWYIDESVQAVWYSKLPSSRRPERSDQLWVPKSIIEHRQKWPVKEGEKWPEHLVTLPEWFCERSKLV